ncbi:hypothetical protein MSSD14B_15310 [Marinobacter salsuginis]|uniref:Uncharacterized protein n=1 Tax=Marinobacter salsuginis TaxID=418719 RepID=A0A5M3PYB0_9GAMM|nr:hypothetical protein MSSD14B_15310 [Marinobacter salsuginis]
MITDTSIMAMSTMGTNTAMIMDISTINPMLAQNMSMPATITAGIIMVDTITAGIIMVDAITVAMIMVPRDSCP